MGGVLTEAKVIRFVLADDRSCVRRAIRRQLQCLGAVEITGEACNGREAVELVKSTRPDLVIMDIIMPEMGGLEATEIIAKECPDIPVVILSSNTAEGWEAKALNAGAAAYVVKGAPFCELEATLRKVLGDKAPPGLSDVVHV
jgi:DNA-binding NarL/FixJ family response regulator